jgi:hypothetical protein
MFCCPRSLGSVSCGRVLLIMYDDVVEGGVMCARKQEESESASLVVANNSGCLGGDMEILL